MAAAITNAPVSSWGPGHLGGGPPFRALVVESEEAALNPSVTAQVKSLRAALENTARELTTKRLVGLTREWQGRGVTDATINRR